MHKLTEGDIELIDRNSLRILKEIGVRVDDEPLRAMALKNGAIPSRGDDRICMPPEMVREYVKIAPADVRFADCSGSVVSISPGCGSTFWTGAALNYVDDGHCSPISEENLGDFIRIADSLDTVFATVGTSIAEVPPLARDIVGLRIMASNTRKHLRPLLFNAQNVKPMIDMAQVIANGRALEHCPLISFGYSCLSPLHWPQVAIDMWRNSSGYKLPVMINGEPLAGCTSPVTLAGSISQSNAEILAGVVLIQLLEPRRPVVHNLGFAHATDMRTAACLSGSAECGLMACAGAQLADFYKLPSASWMSTEAFIEDQQAAMEKLLTGLTHVMGGVNIIWGMGHLESQKAISPTQLIIDDEIARAALRFGRGFSVNAETLAYDVVREIVETGEDFLAHEHTIKHFRRELSESALLVRIARQRWLEQGATTLAQRAAAQVRRVLAQSPPRYLTDQQRKDISAIEQRELTRLG